MKKVIKGLLITVLCLVVVIGIAAGAFVLFYTPSLTADMSDRTGAVTNGASGYLYGIAEEGVPSKNMTESVDISTVSAKVTDGLQHPIGDISHVYTQLENTDYDVVYLQDIYSTWYYEHDAIEQQRADGTYDWKSFVENDYLPKVKTSVEKLSAAPYSDKVVYCLYNECDNGVWFGETKESADAAHGVYGDYNSVGEANFFEAWKMTYDFVRNINPNALIGGPGFCDYDSREIKNFMTYCTENNCVPDIMIYHELNDSSVYHWQNHVKDYRAIEDGLGVNRLPIIVTEYGRMCDNGLPGKMLQYITQIETSKVYAENAYWRLANNLCDVAADDNSPNSNWWLFRWYTDMQGQTVASKYQDLFKSNFGKALKGEAEFSSQGFMGLVTVTDDDDKIEAICGGRPGSAIIKLKNMDQTGLYGKKVCVTVEEVLYKGISGVVNSPVLNQVYYTDVDSKTLTIDMNDMDESSAYHITIVPVDTEEDAYALNDYIARFEFEEGNLLGQSYTYDSAYATTGEKEGMVGGMENDGDGVSLKFSVPEDATYNLDIIYGNSNDGAYDENGKQNPNDRKSATSLMSIDDNEMVMTFDNTIKSEYTDYITVSYELTKGEHTITFKHDKGTIVLDSMLVSSVAESQDVTVLDDIDRTTDTNQSYLAVAPMDGYYDISMNNSSGAFDAYVNGQKFVLADTASDASADSANTVYLMRGLNYIDVKCDSRYELTIRYSELGGSVIHLSADDAKLSDDAAVKHNEELNISYIDNISNESGKADFSVNVEEAGTYALNLLYANNDEGGKHDYNVDLIERYVTVTANGKSQDVYCRNTYSWDTYKTVTCYIELNQGENTISLTNSGNRKFDNKDTYIPYISSASVNEISVY
ncbi:MAG: hypothetical protein NC397_00380 [Clostridium sp.]|nr:hypothetical protein [Clostridium sp.]